MQNSSLQNRIQSGTQGVFLDVSNFHLGSMSMGTPTKFQSVSKIDVAKVGSGNVRQTLLLLLLLEPDGHSVLAT